MQKRWSLAVEVADSALTDNVSIGGANEDASRG
jgi:hypothetical protein